MRADPTRRSLLAILASTGFALACTSVTSSGPGASPCHSQGEFPPTDCAIVRGRAVDGEGRGIAQLGLRVDSMVAGSYVYSSGGVATDSDGRFLLSVRRVNRLTSPTSPDTARVDIKAYGTSVPRAGDQPVARASTLMRFAPLGVPVDTTTATLVFELDH